MRRRIRCGIGGFVFCRSGFVFALLGFVRAGLPPRCSGFDGRCHTCPKWAFLGQHLRRLGRRKLATMACKSPHAHLHRGRLRSGRRRGNVANRDLQRAEANRDPAGLHPFRRSCESADHALTPFVYPAFAVGRLCVRRPLLRHRPPHSLRCCGQRPHRLANRVVDGRHYGGTAGNQRRFANAARALTPCSRLCYSLRSKGNRRCRPQNRSGYPFMPKATSANADLLCRRWKKQFGLLPGNPPSWGGWSAARISPTTLLGTGNPIEPNKCDRSSWKK